MCKSSNNSHLKYHIVDFFISNTSDIYPYADYMCRTQVLSASNTNLTLKKTRKIFLFTFWNMFYVIFRCCTKATTPRARPRDWCCHSSSAGPTARRCANETKCAITYSLRRIWKQCVMRILNGRARSMAYTVRNIIANGPCFLQTTLSLYHHARCASRGATAATKTCA